MSLISPFLPYLNRHETYINLAWLGTEQMPKDLRKNDQKYEWRKYIKRLTVIFECYVRGLWKYIFFSSFLATELHGEAESENEHALITLHMLELSVLRSLSQIHPRLWLGLWGCIMQVQANVKFQNKHYKGRLKTFWWEDKVFRVKELQWDGMNCQRTRV